MSIKINPNAKALIFDLDGTLVDSIKTHHKAWQQAISKFNASFEIEYMFSFTGKPTVQCAQQIIDDFKLPVTAPELMKEKEAIFLSTLDQISLIEPVMNVVKLHKGKLPMGIATGSDSEIANTIVQKTGLHEYIQTIVSCDDVENPKPHPETFTKCAQLLGVHPTECTAFEDGENGMIAATKAGMEVIDVKPFYDRPVWN